MDHLFGMLGLLKMNSSCTSGPNFFGRSSCMKVYSLIVEGLNTRVG